MIKKEEHIESEKIALKKEFTLSSGIAVVVGQIIGSGIFVTPKSILHYAGSFGVCIIIWVLGAVISIAGGFCYIELGLLFKKGGGEPAYLREAYSFKKRSKWSELFGSLISFLFIWSNISILRPAGMGILSLTCSRYLVRPFFGDDEIPEYLIKAVALSILSKFTVSGS